MIKRLLRFLFPDTPHLACPRCKSALTGDPEQGLYCESCHTTFETTPEFHYEEPTKGITYRLTGKSVYGKVHA